MHYWHELDTDQLGEILEISPGAVRVRLHRARAALRDVLAGPAPGAGADADLLVDKLGRS
jgi:DNA-directed RNA polymerase specialized sigma24 family protein